MSNSVGRDLNWNYLYYFFAVMKHRSLRGAAADANVAPSTISEAIQGLERQLNCKLLSRTTRKIEPTERGRLLFNQIKSIYENRSQILSSMASEAPAVMESLAIGIVPGNSFTSLMTFVSDLMTLVPTDKLIIKSCTHEGLGKLIEAGEVDVGLASAPVRSKSVHSSILFSCGLNFYAHCDLGDLPLDNLLPKFKVGLLGSDDSSLSMQQKLRGIFSNVELQFLISDYPSLLFEACRNRRALVIIAEESGSQVPQDIVRIEDSRLDQAFPKFDQFLIWAKRIEGSALHTYLTTKISPPKFDLISDLQV